MGAVKKDCNMTAYQPERWQEIVATRGDRAEKLNLSREFIVALYEKIHDESIKKQLEILQALMNEVKG
jgi:chorismate mutase